jgi:serine/threonine protein phosphatase PrpC
MSKLHNNLRGTRGAVAIIGKLDHDASQFHYVGIGNIVLRKFGNISERAITQDGVIGYQIRTPNEKIMQITSGDILIMHTDGLASTFDINDYPEILRDNAEVIANNLIDKFGKNNDDATCVVIRFN